MRIILRLLCVLCATMVHGFFVGTCPRKDPPPGVLALSPGSTLALACSGHVEVNGERVNMDINNRRGSPSDTTPTVVNITSNTGVPMKSDRYAVGNPASEGYHSIPTEAGENRSLSHTNTGHTASPTAHRVRPTAASRLLEGESNWEAEGTDGEDDYDEEEEGEEGTRVTRGVKSKLQWKWNGRTVGKGDRDWGEFTFGRRGASLSLSSVRLSDSGRYACYHRGRERFSLKVVVADSPEHPGLSCYKRSPSSKIRCEWAAQKPVTIAPNCYLLLSKRPTEAFLRWPCSYSSRRSRCWCALDHNEDELRSLHMAYLCVTSITGNATSPLLHFIPLDILKPDPPSDVSVRQEEGQETRVTVSWSFPKSWKSQDRYYELMYEIRYRPVKSLYWQEQKTKETITTITDAIPGADYLIQLRAKDEYDGHWSDWSSPASSWTVATAATTSPWSLENDDMFPDIEHSGTDDDVSDVPESAHIEAEVSHNVLWIVGSFALLSVILAAYIFRHKDRFMSKLRSLSVTTKCNESARPPPSAPTPPEGQVLVTFAPPHYREPPPNEGEEDEEGEEEDNEEEEEQRTNERIEAMHFNNTSYFFLHRE